MPNHPINEYGVIILGGGCAGLSLARKLVQQHFSLPILILEQRSEYQHDRTWSGWFSKKQMQGLEAIPKRTYTSWSFTADLERVTHESKESAYLSIASEDFYADSLALLKQSPIVELQLNTSLHLSDVERLLTEKDEQTVVVDTIGISRNLQKHLLAEGVTQEPNPKQCIFEPSGLWQRFVGVTVSSNEPLFSPEGLDHAALMHDMQNTEHGFCFHYMLPLTQHSALVETTFFTQKPLNSIFLQQQSIAAAEHLFALSIDKKQVRNHELELTFTASEEGHLPMQACTEGFVKKARGSIIYGGITAGALRPSSGYAFAAIQDWANKVTLSVVAQEAPIFDTYRHYANITVYLDNIFLAVLERYPDMIPKMFLSMANILSAKQFALFMNHQAGLWIWLKVIWAMPKLPFIKAWWMSCRKIKNL